MKKIIMTIGLPGSGKSTWAKQLVKDNPGSYKRVNKDDLRWMMDNYHWTKKNEQMVIEIEEFIVNKALDNGKHVVIDNTHLNPKHISRMKELINKRLKRGDKVCLEINDDFLNVTPEECIERDLKRPNSVGYRVIMKQYNQWLKPKKGHSKEPDPQPWLRDRPDLENCIICDLDGTLCLMNGMRSPYDGAKCINDIKNVPVAEAVKMYFERGYKVILFSGRSDEFKNETLKWLSDNGVNYYDELHMREKGDLRNDAVLKEEMYNKYVKNRFNCRCIFDDRPRIIRMWKELGLSVFDVGPSCFGTEF